jgi:hypothetical protein
MGLSAYQMVAHHIGRFKASHMICRALFHGSVPIACITMFWKLISQGNHANRCGKPVL